MELILSIITPCKPAFFWDKAVFPPGPGPRPRRRPRAHRQSERKLIGGALFNATTVKLEKKMEAMLTSFLLLGDSKHPIIINIEDIFGEKETWFSMWERNFFEEVTLDRVKDFNSLHQQETCYFMTQVRNLH
jgi:hypothetical protein